MRRGEYDCAYTKCDCIQHRQHPRTTAMSGAARRWTEGRRNQLRCQTMNGVRCDAIVAVVCYVFPETAAKSPTAELVTWREQIEIKRRRIDPDQQLCCRDKRSQTQFLEANERDYRAGRASGAGNVLAGREGRKTSGRMHVSSLLRIASETDDWDCIPILRRRFPDNFREIGPRFDSFLCEDFNPRPQILRRPRIRTRCPRTSI